MKTVQEILEATKEYFHRLQQEPARKLAEEVISAALNIKRLQLYLEFDRPLSEKELERCREFLRRKAKREPIQYIVGEVEFYHCRFDVAKEVLIPRQETEQLVDKIVQELKKVDLKEKVLWDVCTGSGCIGIALKKQFPELKVFLSDISPQALALALQNAKKNEVEVILEEGDLLTPFKGQKCHFFVCNPPYVSDEEYLKLEPEVRDFEPKNALVAGDGYDFYRRLAAGLPQHLHRGAKVWFEIGYNQGNYLKDLFRGEYWRNVKVERDYAGIDRFFSLEIE